MLNVCGFFAESQPLCAYMTMTTENVAKNVLFWKEWPKLRTLEIIEASPNRYICKTVVRSIIRSHWVIAVAGLTLQCRPA